MPGSCRVELPSSLAPAEIPTAVGQVAYGESSRCTVTNTGTTTLADVVLEVRGKGKRNVAIGSSDAPTASSLRLSGEIRPGRSATFYARSRYAQGDAEDRASVEVVASARSVG